MNKIFINQTRTPAQRRARYCYLTNGCGFNRATARSIVGRTDSHIARSIEAIYKTIEENKQ